METIEIKGWVHARIYAWAPDKPEYVILAVEDASSMNSGSATYVKVHEFTLCIEPSAIDYRSVRIAALEKEEAKLRADLHRRITEIREEVSRLTAIEHKPAEVL